MQFHPLFCIIATSLERYSKGNVWSDTRIYLLALIAIAKHSLQYYYRICIHTYLYMRHGKRDVLLRSYDASELEWNKAGAEGSGAHRLYRMRSKPTFLWEWEREMVKYRSPGLHCISRLLFHSDPQLDENKSDAVSITALAIREKWTTLSLVISPMNFKFLHLFMLYGFPWRKWKQT